MQTRIGLGSDMHRLEPGQGLWLGGIPIPCSYQAVAHSDGDVVLHALTDAILGALGQADIGELFPDTAAENKNRPSRDFVQEAVARMKKAGFAIGNVDIVVQLQAPKFSPYKFYVRESLARLLGCVADRINIKAKTGEGLPPIGTNEAVQATVVILLTEANE